MAEQRADLPEKLPPGSVHQTDLHDREEWSGPTYYGRSQLKAVPFNNWAVGGYVALAGLCGAASVIAAVADAVQGRAAEQLVRRGRYLALLAPTLGAGLLVWDLHTPKRFYNMFRVAKKTSPMSIGTWILSGFSLAAIGTAASQFAADRFGARWARRAARLTQVPAAIGGAGLATYTAALLSATSTPLWAAAPRSMAVRFAASSTAAAAGALSLMEGSRRRQRSLDALKLTALAAELAATMVSHRVYRQRGVAGALDGKWGEIERVGATGLGAMLPTALQTAAVLTGRRRAPAIGDAASALAMAGSLLLRVSMMEAGGESARRPEVSFRFTQG